MTVSRFIWNKNADFDASKTRMCNLYYADLWIMPTIGPELSLAAVIAASESA